MNNSNLNPNRKNTPKTKNKRQNPFLPNKINHNLKNKIK